MSARSSPRFACTPRLQAADGPSEHDQAVETNDGDTDSELKGEEVTTEDADKPIDIIDALTLVFGFFLFLSFTPLSPFPQ